MLKSEKPFRLVAINVMVVAFIVGAFLSLPGSIKSQPAALPPNQDEVHVFVSVMDPRIVSDTFGKRIAERFVGIQVTIANHNKDYQYLINDVSLDLNKVFPSVAARKSHGLYYTSSAELSLLRGVAEKGQGQDTRNKTLRLFRGIGTIAAGLIGVTNFGISYPKSVAIFNGPVISAFSEAFPDYTINQMNRLNDSAYQANTLIPQKHSKVIVAFIPLGIFLDTTQQKNFYKDPTSVYAEFGKCSGTGCVDFRLVEAYIDGDYITQVSNMPPTVTTAVFDATEQQKFDDAKPIVKGFITGRFLTGSAISLLNPEPKGLSIELDGAPTADRINFIIKSDKPVPPGTPLDFEITNAQGVQRYRKDLLYMPDPPTLTAIAANSGKVGTPVTVTLTGTNFIPGPGNTRVEISGGDVEVSDPVDVRGTSLKVTFRIGANAATTPRQVTVINANSESAPVTFTINP
ncbi:MAG: hypothetical protein QOE96_2288 [Blastocatellia bacterium]|nr:hypothetical protein [Blastocatellia bacterium]